MQQYTHISSLVAELLYKHDCVIIPKFGGFVSRQYQANFNAGNTLLYPPSKQILFNKNLIHNDGLLVSALMEKNQISFDESSKLVEDFKDYVSSLLSMKKRFELENIGLLYIDGENAIRFESKVDVNFLLDSFGFEPVMASELVIEKEPVIVSKQFEDRKIIVSNPVVKKRSYAKIATLAIGVPLTLAFLLFAAYSAPMKPILQSSLNPFYTPDKTYNSNIVRNKQVILNTVEPTEIIEDINGYGTFKLAENGPTYVATSNEISSTSNKKTVTTYNHTITKSNALKVTGKYQVVVGCFGVLDNANKLVKELSSKKLLAGVSGTNAKGLHVVSCGGFESKDEAQQLLATIKASYPNAWVMTK